MHTEALQFLVEFYDTKTTHREAMVERWFAHVRGAGNPYHITIYQQLKAMPSSLNDACRTMEVAAEIIAKQDWALRSIAGNTCCNACQEAAKVAQKALLGIEDEGPNGAALALCQLLACAYRSVGDEREHQMRSRPLQYNDPRMQTPPNGEKPRCPSCQAVAENWWSYCAMCGHHIAATGLAFSKE